MSLDQTGTDGKAEANAKVKNTLAVHSLTLSFENEEQFRYIEDARSDKWHSALVYEIWASLEDENKPSDALALAEMLKKLLKLKLSNKKDHKKLCEKIAMIQGEYTCKVD